MKDRNSKIDRRSLLAIGGGAIALGAIGTEGVRAVARRPSRPAALPDMGGAIPIAFVMGPGATMIDFAGPWEVFQDTGGNSPTFYLYTVSGSTSELDTSGNYVSGKSSGLHFRPDFSFADAPQPRIIVMGAQEGHTPEKIDWIRKAAVKADVVMSVCTGAFLLAKTGLLDGLEATTHHEFFDSFAKQFPQVRLNRGVRYVDNGKFVTAGGLTSGIDGALHVVDRLRGREEAQRTAAYMEHSSTQWRQG
jgi:transcriptional regulator GlxA family with amidase domain